MSFEEFTQVFPGSGITRIEHDRREMRDVMAGIEGRADVYVVDDGLVIREKGSTTAKLIRLKPSN